MTCPRSGHHGAMRTEHLSLDITDWVLFTRLSTPFLIRVEIDNECRGIIVNVSGTMGEKSISGTEE